MFKPFFRRELPSILFFVAVIYLRFPGIYGNFYKEFLLTLLVIHVFQLRYKIFKLKCEK